MKTLNIQANWNLLKGLAKQKFARWTNDELQFAEGKQDELTGRILKRACEGEEHAKHSCSDESCCACHPSINPSISHQPL